MKKFSGFGVGFSILLAALAVTIFPILRSARAADGALSGKVVFQGTAPPLPKIRMEADPTCLLQYGGEGAPSEEVVINANGTLKNVFVYVKEGLEGQAFEPPAEPVVFDQKGCRYEPRVFGIQVNQPLQIVNSDATLHNVHALPANSKEFNLGMPIQGMKLTQKFTAPEIMVKLKCEVHPWMAAYAGVLSHPFYGVTGGDGTFKIEGLPPGQYVLEAWHERYGSQTQTVTVPEATEVTFTYTAAQ